MAWINFSQWSHMSQLLDELLDELLDADDAQRAQHLAQIGDHDPEIAAQLTLLLALQPAVETAHFLEGTPLTAVDCESFERWLFATMHSRMGSAVCDSPGAATDATKGASDGA